LWVEIKTVLQDNKNVLIVIVITVIILLVIIKMMNTQKNLYTIEFSQYRSTNSCIARSRAVIMEPVGFLELTNFVDFAKLTNFA